MEATISRSTDNLVPRTGPRLVQTAVMVDDSILEALRLSDQRAIRTVDSLTDTQWHEPSTLPDWTRAHVVAHLTLNAEGFARALDGVQDGKTVATYDSLEARDADIAELGAASTAEIRDRYFAATANLRHGFGALTAEQWTGSITRFPDGPPVPIAVLPTFRRREVEIHHADLDAGYAAADWPADFTLDLLELIAADRAASGESAFTVEATDLGRTWPLGADFPVVSGPASALAWWLVGRGEGQDLTSTDGPLPVLSPW